MEVTSKYTTIIKFSKAFEPRRWVMPENVGLLESMGLPALAGGMAVCLSHPLELTKVRLQLDNELASRGTVRKYKGWIGM